MVDNHDVKNRKLLEKQRVQNRFAFYEVHIGHFLFYIVNATLQLLFAVMTECRDLVIFVLTNRLTEPITLPLAHAHGVITIQGNLT